MKHKSVMLNEVIDYLNVSEGKTYIDATVGYAGHSGEILRKLNKKGFLFAFDQDDEAIKYSQDKLSKIANNFKIIKSNFVNMKDHIDTKVDGILFDLGVSSPQLDEEERGFSFHKDARLHMRMDKDNPLDAYKVVNEYSYEKLIEIIFRFGEEKYAKSIAKAIVENRPIETTLQLSEIIKNSVPISYRNKSHPARKTFQALRIAVNGELDRLREGLENSFDVLQKDGRLAVITFHSLEDRIVKKTMAEWCTGCTCPKEFPVCVCGKKPRAELVTKRPIEPGEAELEDNNRARSARLRVCKKLF